MRASYRSLACGTLAGVFSLVAIITHDMARAADQPQRGTATVVSAEEIAAAIKKMGSRRVGEEPVRIVGVNGDYNVGVEVVRHGKLPADAPKFAIEHSDITEIHYFVSGRGVFLTGGAIKDPRQAPPESATVTLLDGPSRTGAQITGGERRTVGPGDIVIVPPDTPHGWAEISSDEVVYLVFKIDPHKVLPAGLGEKTDEETSSPKP